MEFWCGSRDQCSFRQFHVVYPGMMICYFIICICHRLSPLFPYFCRLVVGKSHPRIHCCKYVSTAKPVSPSEGSITHQGSNQEKMKENFILLLKVRNVFAIPNCFAERIMQGVKITFLRFCRTLTIILNKWCKFCKINLK